jgi:hypothetical protein
MAQSLLQSGVVHLTGMHHTVNQIAAFIESLEKQLRTHSYDPWHILNSQILNSQTLKHHPTSDWRNDWDVNTFINGRLRLLETMDRRGEVRLAGCSRQAPLGFSTAKINSVKLLI